MPRDVKNVRKRLDKAAREFKEDTLMKIKFRYEKVKFEDAVKQFNFNQFYEICKIFHVNVIDKENFSKLSDEAKAENKQLDLSKVKMRRDFDKMTEELIEAYHSLPRRNRRQIDPIIAKIVWGNKKANKITTDRIVDTYNAGLANLEDNEVSTETAAAPSESDN